MADQLEQRAQAFAGVRHLLQAAEDAFLFHGFPALQRRLQQGIARREVPVEAAFCDTQPAGERFHRHGRDTLLRDEIEGRLGPIVRAQAGVARGSGRAAVGAGCAHVRI